MQYRLGTDYYMQTMLLNKNASGHTTDHESHPRPCDMHDKIMTRPVMMMNAASVGVVVIPRVT